MAKKSSNIRKSASEASIPALNESVNTLETQEPEPTPAVVPETAPAKTKVKANEDLSANSIVGISDIRKAVAFANSVGGLDKAIALLQILKVAKEVQ